MRSRPLAFGLCMAGILGLSLLSLLWGSADISLTDIWTAIWSPGSLDSPAVQIVWELRLPRVIAAVLGGAALALSGLVLQTVFRNPLAGPYVLGVSSGASLGVALLLLGGFGSATLGVLSAASLGAGSVLMLVLLLARWVSSPVNLLVLGLMVGYVVDAMISVLIHFSDSEELRGFVTWSFGSFGRVQPGQLPWFAGVVLVGLLLSFVSVKYLNGVALGEEGARTLGIDVRRSRAVALVAASLLAAVATAFCGPVGFIGLAVPHLARGVFRTANHRVLIPGSVLLGSLLALLAGWIAQWPGEAGVLPLNAITSLMGAPVVIWILLPRQSRRLE